MQQLEVLLRAQILNPQGEFLIDNLLVRIRFIIMMIGWTGLAPWEAAAPPPPLRGLKTGASPYACLRVGVMVGGWGVRVRGIWQQGTRLRVKGCVAMMWGVTPTPESGVGGDARVAGGAPRVPESSSFLLLSSLELSDTKVYEP